MRRRLMIMMLCLAVATTGFAQKKRKTQPQRLKVGLVLGGGGAKGAAHAGALKVIEDAGIPIDYIAGTSIGSIVGGLYACGYRSEELQEMFRTQEWLTLLGDRNEEQRRKVLSRDDDGVVYVLGFPVGRRGTKLADKSIGLMRGDHVVSLIDSMVCLKLYADRRQVIPDGDREQGDVRNDFAFLHTPFRCVAADMKHGEEYVFTKGKLSTALRASMAIPGAFKPVRMDSLLLVDGGMLNNLPVDVVKAMGADVVIAIDLTQNKHEDEEERLSLKETLGIGGLLDWVVSRPDLKKYHENCKAADVYINPDLSGYSAGSFKPKAIDDMMERGYKAANEKRSELKKLRKRVAKGR